MAANIVKEISIDPYNPEQYSHTGVKTQDFALNVDKANHDFVAIRASLPQSTSK
jgi:hypothetical protein